MTIGVVAGVVFYAILATIALLLIVLVLSPFFGLIGFTGGMLIQ